MARLNYDQQSHLYHRVEEILLAELKRFDLLNRPKIPNPLSDEQRMQMIRSGAATLKADIKSVHVILKDAYDFHEAKVDTTAFEKLHKEADDKRKEQLTFYRDRIMLDPKLDGLALIEDAKTWRL